MTKAEWAITKTIQINRTLSVEMTMGPGGWITEWTPSLEAAFKMSKQEFKIYVRGRSELAHEVAARLGKSVAIIDLDPTWLS